MKRLPLIFLAALTLSLVTSCKSEKKETPAEAVLDDTTPVETNDVKKIEVILESKSNSSVQGTAVFTEENGQVTLVATLSGMTEGEHAIHLHEKADCSSDDGTSTGGHWNPTNQPHGKWGSAEGYHKGDIGNILADADGNGSITMSTDEWCIGCGDPKRDIIGTAVIVHEGTDDFITQPTGDAGGRVSCGGIVE